jgi:hypothetical protein
VAVPRAIGVLSLFFHDGGEDGRDGSGIFLYIQFYSGGKIGLGGGGGITFLDGRVGRDGEDTRGDVKSILGLG